MISPKSIISVLAVFISVVAIGYFAVSNTPTTAQEIFPSNRIAPTMNQPFSPTVAKGNMQTLIRGTYQLPASAAEKMTAVFSEEYTALVECRTDQGEGKLVDFVVTAEPATQHAISAFINTVFPKENFNQLKKGTADKDTDEAASVMSTDLRD